MLCSVFFVVTCHFSIDVHHQLLTRRTEEQQQQDQPQQPYYSILSWTICQKRNIQYHAHFTPSYRSIFGSLVNLRTRFLFRKLRSFQKGTENVTQKQVLALGGILSLQQLNICVFPICGRALISFHIWQMRRGMCNNNPIFFNRLRKFQVCNLFSQRCQCVW